APAASPDRCMHAARSSRPLRAVVNRIELPVVRTVVTPMWMARNMPPREVGVFHPTPSSRRTYANTPPCCPALAGDRLLGSGVRAGRANGSAARPHGGRRYLDRTKPVVRGDPLLH